MILIEWKNLYRGVLMGVSDLIPGISGGTIAVVLGIYDRLLAAISGFSAGNGRSDWAFDSAWRWNWSDSIVAESLD